MQLLPMCTYSGKSVVLGLGMLTAEASAKTVNGNIIWRDIDCLESLRVRKTRGSILASEKISLAS